MAPNTTGVEPAFTPHKPPKEYTKRSLVSTYNLLHSNPSCQPAFNIVTTTSKSLPLHITDPFFSPSVLHRTPTDSTQTPFQPHPTQQLKLPPPRRQDLFTFTQSKHPSRTPVQPMLSPMHLVQSQFTKLGSRIHSSKHEQPSSIPQFNS